VAAEPVEAEVVGEIQGIEIAVRRREHGDVAAGKFERGGAVAGGADAGGSVGRGGLRPQARIDPRVTGDATGRADETRVVEDGAVVLRSGEHGLGENERTA
jgi:hypothetical protein